MGQVNPKHYQVGSILYLRSGTYEVLSNDLTLSNINGGMIVLRNIVTGEENRISYVPDIYMNIFFDPCRCYSKSSLRDVTIIKVEVDLDMNITNLLCDNNEVIHLVHELHTSSDIERVQQIPVPFDMTVIMENNSLVICDIKDYSLKKTLNLEI